MHIQADLAPGGNLSQYLPNLSRAGVAHVFCARSDIDGKGNPSRHHIGGAGTDQYTPDRSDQIVRPQTRDALNRQNGLSRGGQSILAQGHTVGARVTGNTGHRDFKA